MADKITEVDFDSAPGGRMPSKKAIRDTRKRYEGMKSDMDEARGELGSLLKNAENDDNIHRKAFKDALKIAKMDDLKREEYLAHIGLYLETFGVERTGDLFRDAA